MLSRDVMAPEEPSNLRVYIRWHEQTVFAGEEVKCTIVFKNVSSMVDTKNQIRQLSGPQSDRSRLHGRAKAATSLTSPITTAGHRRSALSLSVPSSGSKGRSDSLSWPVSAGLQDERQHRPHQRSISIVSIGSTQGKDDHETGREPPLHSQRPQFGHNRAASLQVVPRGPVQPPPSSRPGKAYQTPTLEAQIFNNDRRAASQIHRQNSSPLLNSSHPTDRLPRADALSKAPTSFHTAAQVPRRSPRGSPNPMPAFQFPAPEPSPLKIHEIEDNAADGGLLSPTAGLAEHGGFPSRLKEQTSNKATPSARILASTSLTGAGTPRSSGEFYSVSNHSTETLASEYVIQQPARGIARPPHLRKSSGLNTLAHKSPESVMMGYAQIQGSFSLDGSLVSLGPFEQVKRKAVVGGRGGGVVGIDSAKRDSGFMRGFGWSNISTSWNDLLGGNELSSIKEIRGAANSKSVPLLSTPQSLLFVDMKLAAGESRSFEYSFRIPRGLPPTHKGKAIKICYSLVIGTQRAGGAKEQQVRSVEAPFKVLGGVNNIGEILGHDLMSPYVLFRDEALVKSLAKPSKPQRPSNTNATTSSLNDFLSYVDELAARPGNDADGILLSPTEAPNSRRPSGLDQTITAREAIHLAIMRSNVAGDSQQSPNRFEIARNGQRVGVVMITRPAYRLGEVITMVVDFTDAEIPCFALHCTLETSERVDSSLAVRSESSISRVTRKVFASSSEATLYSRRVVFTPTIPITATPEFVTSGISLEWRIRVEFVVPFSGSEASTPGELPTSGLHPLLEKISQDDKGGLLLAAVENLACESFDVPVPVKVYGAVGQGLERLERDEASEEGLAI